MSTIFDASLNEAKELFTQAFDETKKSKGSRVFRDVAREVAFERGWEFGPSSTPAIDREFDGLVLALLYMSNIQALHGLEPLGVMVGALEAGRQARADEAVATNAAAGGDLE